MFGNVDDVLILHFATAIEENKTYSALPYVQEN